MEDGSGATLRGAMSGSIEARVGGGEGSLTGALVLPMLTAGSASIVGARRFLDCVVKQMVEVG